MLRLIRRRLKMFADTICTPRCSVSHQSVNMRRSFHLMELTRKKSVCFLILLHVVIIIIIVLDVTIYLPNTKKRLVGLNYSTEIGSNHQFISGENLSLSNDTKERMSFSLNIIGDTQTQRIPPCGTEDLVGRIRLNNHRLNVTTLEGWKHGMEPGGRWMPEDCLANQTIAIIIPFRNRHSHLMTLLYNLVPILQRQRANFRIFVVEQKGRKVFNKGRVMNAGFKEAWKMGNFKCFIFHDVDMIPEDDRNMYICSEYPRHLSVAVDKFKYELPYPNLVGGVLALTRENFVKVNGYSNYYWGWGAEDDDMAIRIRSAKLKLNRPATNVARYVMIKHGPRKLAPMEWKHYLLKTVRKRYTKDGLNSLEYNVSFIHNKEHYTHIMVDIGNPPVNDFM